MNSSDLFETLENEFKELIEKIESEVLELENSQNPEIIHSIFRAIHTIKGNSAMVGMDRLRGISHCLETLFSRIRSKEMELKTEMIEIILKSTDRMKVMILDLKNEANYDVKDLIIVLEKILNGNNSQINIEEKNDEEDFSFFIETAKSENNFLSLVDINFAANPSLTLGEWIQKLNSIEPNLLLKRVNIPEIINISEGQTKYGLPYSILIITAEHPKVFLEKNKIPYSKINQLHSSSSDLPETKPNKEVARTNAYLKVPTNVIDTLINLAGEAVIARNQLFRSLNLEEDSEEEIRMSRVSQSINTIYNRLMKVRLQKLDSIFPRLQRVARDASKTLGKDVKLHLEGHDIELDEIVIEGITESLLHIIRNSIDHGLELEQERISIGKKPQGQIFFKASISGGNIVIEIKDDGKGLDFEKIKNKALEKKLISKEEALALTEDQFTDLIFLPGFSTNEQVSEVSGRGVGMDVVLTNFKKFGGSIKINTEFGKGTTLRGIIPQTLSVLPAFIISVLGNKFALLQKHIMELNKYSSEHILSIDTNRIYKKGDRLIPIIDLGQLLFPDNKNEKEFENIAILKSEERTFAICFNYIISIEEIVLKPVPNQLKSIELYGGTTLDGEGSAVLLLEPEGLIKFSTLQLEKDVILDIDSQKKVVANSNYLAFEISNQIFLVHASEIFHVWKIHREQIQFVFEKEMISIEGNLIPSFRLETFFNLRQTDNPETLFCLISKNTGTTTAIPIHHLLDMFDSIEIKENTVIENEFVEGIITIENKTALHISLSKILNSHAIEAP